MIKSLAFACLALDEVPDSLPCNPAMTPRNTKPNLRAEGILSNGYSNLAKTRKLLAKSPTQETVETLLSDERTLQVESNVNLMFSSQYVNSRLTPLSYKFFSVTRNDANPDIDMIAVEASEFAIQTGYSYGQFDFGIELKTFSWKFIKQRFKLLSLATPEGLAAIKPKKQNGFFAQPAITYRLPLDWSPRIAVQVVNIGSVNKKFDEFKREVEPQVGFGISPPMAYGKLDLLLDIKKLNEDDKDDQVVHLGALYRYGALNLGGGVDDHGVSLGIFYGLEQINAGISFTSTSIPWRKDDYYAQTVYVQVGWQL